MLFIVDESDSAAKRGRTLKNLLVWNMALAVFASHFFSRRDEVAGKQWRKALNRLAIDTFDSRPVLPNVSFLSDWDIRNMPRDDGIVIELEIAGGRLIFAADGRACRLAEHILVR